MENTFNKEKHSIYTSVNTRDTLVYSICILCMMLFLCSAFSKVLEHEAFYNGLSKVAIIGRYAKLIAWLVPIAELIVCLLLLIPKTYKYGLYGFASLMTVFTTYILVMLAWAKTLPCHCNLFVENLSWGQHVWFNLGFIGLAIWGIQLSNSIKS